MTAKGNPCGKNCPERSITCHGTCERYAEFWAKCEEARKKRAMDAGNRSMSPGLRKALVKKAARIRQWREK